MTGIFIFLFLAVFPFGQIIRMGVIHPIDIIVGLTALYVIYKKLPKPPLFRYLLGFLAFAGFSWIVSSLIFRQIEVFYGLFYLLRIFAYSYFFAYVWNFAKIKTSNRNLLLNSLLSLSVVSSIFGWFQFFKFPDIKPFFTYGWDEHLFRLVGTFLDPTFLSLIIVFGLIISISKFIDTRQKKFLISTIFLFVSLAFTYSRAGYLAFAGGGLILAYYKKHLKQTVLIFLGLILIALIAPTAKNRSIELFRSFSAIARIENYKETIEVFKTSPLFGVGFNNICLARQKYIGPASFSSHACSGSDSSLLLVLTTTGVVGSALFILAAYKLINVVIRSPKFYLLNSCLVALFIHSLFSNSLFYPWVMGYIAILTAVNLGGKVKS